MLLVVQGRNDFFQLIRRSQCYLGRVSVLSSEFGVVAVIGAPAIRRLLDIWEQWLWRDELRNEILLFGCNGRLIRGHFVGELVLEALVEEPLRREVGPAAFHLDLRAIFVRPVLGGLMSLCVQLRQRQLALDEVLRHVYVLSVVFVHSVGSRHFCVHFLRLDLHGAVPFLRYFDRGPVSQRVIQGGLVL